MRKIIITLLLMATIIASAQNVQKINERYFQAKVSELALRLEMTDSQKTKFIPVYRRYSEEMRQTVGVKQRPSKSLTDEERLELTKRKMQRQQQAQAIRIKYIDEFSRFLSASQVSRFFEVESEIQKKLMERRNRTHG
jgi:superfamily I DNA and RNA helicase